MIDDVIGAIKPEFDEFGVSEDVLAELQHVSMRFRIVVSQNLEIVARNGKVR